MNIFNRLKRENKQTISIAIISIAVVLLLSGYFPIYSKNKYLKDIPTPKNAEAMYRYDPAIGVLVTGTTAPILGATAPVAEGVNVGDWRGTEADDNLHWGFTSTASGYNAYFDIANVNMRGANKFIIQTEFDLDTTVPRTRVQICDWKSSTGVDSVADTECTGGGWRTLNVNKTLITTTTATAYAFEIYNGYWNSSATAKVDTPLTNFIDSTEKVRIRFYSNVSSAASVVNIDFVRLFVVIDPVYSASGVTIISGGTPTGSYASSTIGGAGQTGSDNAYFIVPGTAATTSNFYFSHTGVKPYAGANTILYRAEYSCSNTGINIKPKIYNFTSGLWEDLTTATIACSATDATNAWAKNNISMGDYLSGGEIRIGWYGSANNVIGIRIDLSYIMIGTVTNDNSQITFGSLSAGTSTNTRTLDMTGVTTTWNILSANESNTQAFASYAFDGDNDVTAEEASAANMNFTIIPPIDSSITGIFYASRHMSGVAGTVQIGIGDAGGVTAAAGGWTQVGTVGTTALTYTDNIQQGAVTTGGSAGLFTNPGNHVDFTQNRLNVRLRTTVSGASTNNSVAQWDFAMVSIQWVENKEHRTGMARYDLSNGVVVTGTAAAILGATAATGEGVNVGDWRGAEADDNLHFGFTSTASGYNAYADIEGVTLDGANTLIVQTEFDLDTTVPTTYVQICDWVSSASVNNIADTQCTNGGWRNLNINDVGITTTTATAYSWHIYNGYWNSTATINIDTPLSNFINNGKVRIRYYSSVSSAASVVNIDYIRLFTVINPIYFAASATQISGGTITGDYSMTKTAGAGQTGSDNAYFTVPGTAATTSNFYLSYNNVKTYEGANTILYRAEYSCSTTGINIKPKIYNFTSGLWEDLTTATITCSATDATNAWAKSDITISNYINNGEIRVGWYGSANNTLSIRLDLSYIMIGTVMNGTSQITFGSLSAGTSANTKTLDMTAAVSTWNILSADESNTQGFASYAYDGDNDATVEEASAANMDFTLIPPKDTQVTGILFAGRYMSGVAGTVNLGVADAGGLVSVQGGWTQVGANGTTALNYSDSLTMASVASGGHAGLYVNPYDYVDAETGKMNMRLRTSVSGATTNNSVAQWDFAMLSLQWLETPMPPATITFSISDYSIGFGTLSSSETKYATGDNLGATTPTVAHTISASTNSPGGYVITLSGTPLQSGSNTINEAGDNPVSSVVNSEQFGLNVSASGGYGYSYYPYSTTNNYAFSLSTPNIIGINYSSDNIQTDYSMTYMANITGDTVAGEYSTVLTYTVTATF